MELNRTPDADPGAAAADRLDDGDRDVSGEYARFLEEMEELGLLDDLEEGLPPDFSAVFEIGRILASPDSETGRALGAALQLRTAEPPPEPDEDENTDRHRLQVPAAEEYEAEFIRTWRDVQHVYSWQWLLPEEVFLRRLAQRTLWFPMAKAPRIRRIEGNEGDFVPTPAKQKAYVLFDTSASMSLHHRFAYAKAIVLRFLRENRREMGEVFLRTFDAEIGPLESASDRRAFDELVHRVARRHTLGNGTCLEKAIFQACRDIRERKGLAGAEILVVTDGAAHLDEFAVAEALGRDIELHCVKIGSVAVAASDRWVSDVLEYSHHARTRREQKIVQLRERTERLRRALEAAKDDSFRRGIRDGLAECEEERRVLAAELRHSYGHEIERVAHVFVQVPDLAPEALGISPEKLASIDRLVARLLARLGETPAPPEVLKQAALLLSHVAMLGAEQADPEMRKRLEALREQLEHRLTAAMEHHEERVLDAGLISHADQRDLRILLRRGVTRYSSLWLVLLRYFYGMVARVTGRRR